MLFNRCWTWANGLQVFDGMVGEGGGFKYGALRENVNTVTRTITNCISADSPFLGYDENNSGAQYYNINGEFYHNISYSNYIGFGNFSNNTDDLPYVNKYKNNISFNEGLRTRGDESGDIVEEYNNWVAGNYSDPTTQRITTTNADFVSVDSTGISGARGADGSLPVLTFLHLAASSDLIGEGIDVGLTLDGDSLLRDPAIITLGPFDPNGGEIIGDVYPSLTTSTPSPKSILATAGGNVTSDGGASVTERGVVWATSINPTTSNNKVVVSGTTGSYSAEITGLTSNTTYHVRSFATNSVGTSYGADVSFTTPKYSHSTSLHFSRDGSLCL